MSKPPESAKFEFSNATNSDISQGERAGEPERLQRTVKVQSLPLTLLLENYGEFGRLPKVDSDGLNLDSKVAEFRHFRVGTKVLRRLQADRRGRKSS